MKIAKKLRSNAVFLKADTSDQESLYYEDMRPQLGLK